MDGNESALEKWPGKSEEEIKSAYDELAGKIDTFQWIIHLQNGSQREYQFSQAEGRVLDVACGSGENFRYYPDGIKEVVGIDISPAMLDLAREEAADQGMQADIREMNAQNLEFEDDAFDTVTSSFSTCTFPEPIDALNEMARVCKPDGKVILLEHGEADAWPLAKFQNWRADSEYQKTGCRLLEDPADLVTQSELEIVDTESWWFGVKTGIAARPSSNV